MSVIHLLSYICVRALLLPFAFLPYSTVHKVGRVLGLGIYYLVPKFRKRSLSNLALASRLNLKEAEIIAYAKASLQTLMITCLEYGKFAREKKISRIVHCDNPEVAADLINKKQAVIFFCGHQSNWETLFLEGTSRMPGVAIGRPIPNKFLYNWIVSIREKFGGMIITPRNAIREGLRGLKQGKFLGIVGDQGMPDSGFSCNFLGRMAWTSPAPAILSHRTGCPMFVAMTRCENNHYIIHYSDPIWPNTEAPMNEEVDRMMKKALGIFEDSIAANPKEWLWSHNRWKQQLPGRLKKVFRYDSIAVVMPEEKDTFEDALFGLSELEKIYPTEPITVFVPRKYKSSAINPRFEIKYYENPSELFVRDYRFKLVFNFSETNVKAHYLSLSAFHVFSRIDLEKMTQKPHAPLTELLQVCYAS